MTAQSAHEYDPVEILRVLPGRYREQFLAEYDAAVTGARRPERYRELHHLLRLWRLRAVAYSDPGYEPRLQAMREASRLPLVTKQKRAHAEPLAAGRA